MSVSDFPMQPTAEKYLRLHGNANLEKTRYCVPYLIRYNIACVIDLAERSVIRPDVASNVLKALLDIAGEGLPLDPALEDVQPNLEQAVRVRAGAEFAASLTLGRARRECAHVAQYLAVRADSLEVLSRALDFEETLLSRAQEHLRTLVPYYTGFRRAEPITFGYYLGAFAEEFEVAISAVQGTYALLHRSPAGSANVIPGPVPLDRSRVAGLLGMRQPVRFSLYGQNNIDVPLMVLGMSAMLASSLLRMLSDLSLWHSSDIGIVTFADAYSGGSFIMPQKRNASWMRPARRLISEARSRYAQASESVAHSVPMSVGELLSTMPVVHEGLTGIADALDLSREAVATMAVNERRGRELAGKDLTQSLELVGVLMKQGGMTWRTAEKAVGAMAEEARRENKDDPAFTAQLCQKVLTRTTHGSVSIPEAEFDRALDAWKIVEGRGDSGPQPEAVAGNLSRQRQLLEEMRASVRAEQSRLDAVWRQLEDRACEMSGQ